MPQNEQLREALWEIEVLRKREQAALRETRALLDISQIIAHSEKPIQALQKALHKTADILGADSIAIGELTGRTLTLETTTDPSLRNRSVRVEPAFFSKPRNIPDLTRAKPAAELSVLFGADMRSALVAPTRSDPAHNRVLLVLSKTIDRFTNQDLGLVKRINQIAAQALRNLELSAQNALLAAVIDGSSSGFTIADATTQDMPLVFVNRAFETLTGYTASEVLGTNCRFLSAEDKLSPVRKDLRTAVQQRQSGRFLLRNLHKSGRLFWNDLALFPVRDEDGTVTHIVATQSDATERVAAEDATHIAQSRLQDALDHTRDAYLLILQDGTVAFSNDSARAMFPATGYEWAVGTSFHDNWSRYMDGLSRIGITLVKDLAAPDLDTLCERPGGIRTGLPDGRQILFRAQKTDENAVVISATDTTAIRNTERMLRQRAAAVENANDGIGLLDENSRIVYANSALARLLGHDSEVGVVGRKWSTHYSTPDAADQLRAEFSLPQNAQILQLNAPKGPQQLHEITLTQVDKVGDVIAIRDLTRAVRNRYRLAELDKQMEDSRRREAISTLAAGLAHDFNNVLSAISGSATLIATEDNVTDDIKAHAARISKAGATAARLVNRMLDLGRVDDDAAIFDLRSVLEEMKALAEVNFPKDATLSLDEGQTALSIRAAVADITSVILNLVLNASDALPAGRGDVRVSLHRYSRDHTHDPMLGRVAPGRSYAMIRVQDTGGGIAPDVLPNILHSFFTTKGSRGTGAGLAMVAAIVKRLEGVLFVQTEIGQGTCIDVLLPLADNSANTDHTTQARADLSGMTLLILDDQRDVANVLSSFLENCGAETSVLDDPALAIETICEDPNDWSALITDYDMPDLTGGDVIEALRDTVPDFPVFVVTALARRLSDPRISGKSVKGVFAKPTNLEQLAKALEKIGHTT